MEEAIKFIDFTILEGHRGKDLQNLYYEQGKSKLKYPQSKHNKYPSLAVDIAPYPINWNDRERFVYLAGIIKGIASSLGHNIRWGGDWNQNNNLKDQSFFDLPHFEIVE
jgi:peptidoglycan L-alanyl-D-glutamate endopeptidase CwlK